MNTRIIIKDILIDPAGSGNDEFYTPEYAVLPILKYLKPNSNVWCPFDTFDSNFYKLLKLNGHNPIISHIETGGDFFNMISSDFKEKGKSLIIDYIISNPPYSLKTDVFKKLFERGIPFAMLVGVVGLFESQKRFEMFKDNEFEIMYLNRRVSYFKNYDDQKPSLNPPFSSVYLCSGILPEKIMFEEIKKL